MSRNPTMPEIRAAMDQARALDGREDTETFGLQAPALLARLVQYLDLYVDKEPVEQSRFTDARGAEWVSCSRSHCPNAERYEKATERGWQHGHMDTWHCPRHATDPHASTRVEPGGGA